MKHVIIKAMTINEAWFRAIKTCFAFGHDYKIDKGEYEGQFRRELDLVTLHIRQPYLKPLACSLPSIVPTTDEKIEEYFWNYLMDEDFQSDEEEKYNEYKYASWIAPSWEHCCQLLAKGKGGCNQATISLGKGASDHEKFTHPPCLRLIDMRLNDSELVFIVYFRSWDLIAGLPQNLGGIQMLKSTCVDMIETLTGNVIYDGPIVAISKGLHIYDHFQEIVRKDVGPYEYLRAEDPDTLSKEQIDVITF
jgi:thymidylate synthase